MPSPGPSHRRAHDASFAAAAAGSGALLDYLPELGEDLPEAARAEAARALVLRLVDVPVGRSRHLLISTGADPLGFLVVVEGLALVDVLVGGRRAADLVGASDVVAHAEAGPTADGGTPVVGWRVIRALRLAVLDAASIEAAGRWPTVLGRLLRRESERRRALMARLCLVRATRVEERLAFLLWQLAGRHGRVTPDGVVVSLPLTHAEIGLMVGAHRPSVTVGFRRLLDAGRVERAGDRQWLLRNGDAAELLDGV